MNFHSPIYTTHRPQQTPSHFNEDARCDNEVNLILKSNCNPSSTDQSAEKVFSNEQSSSLVVNQIDQYYFMPIREPNNTMILTNGDNASLFVTDTHHPPAHSLFTQLSLPASIHLSDSNSLTATNPLYPLIDADLAALFVSTVSIEEKAEPNNDPPFDEVFLSSVNDLVSSSEPITAATTAAAAMGPPPGFENFHLDSALSNHTTNGSTTDDTAMGTMQSQVLSTDTINFSQLLPSTLVDLLEPTATGDPVRSSSSSSSQINSTNTSSSSITHSTKSIVKPPVLNSLSLMTKQISSSSSSASLNTSPARATKLIDVDANLNYAFSSSNSFFNHDHTSDPSKHVSADRPVSSSTSSSSSIDEALIHLTQQQSSKLPTLNKLFNDEPSSIFHFPSSRSLTQDHHQDEQQRAVHDNIQFLASMTTASAPVPAEPPWPATARHSSHLQPSRMMQPALNNLSTYLQESMDKLNEVCYRGFDELNTLIQEQRWVQNYLNMNLSSNSPLVSSNCGSSRILIVPEYFIFKCKKVEITASQIFELLAIKRPELRLRDLMYAFKDWKESISTIELIHQEEETKLRLTMEHSPSYYMHDTVLQAGFERLSHALRQLSNKTQQARAAFQYATLNVFQTASRQQQQGQGSSNVMTLAQFPGNQQQAKSSSLSRMNSSIGSSP